MPGLREARVPLSAGLIWLVVAAVGTSWVLPHLRPTLLFEQVGKVSEFAGVPATLAAIAFLAYLIGVTALSIRPLGGRQLRSISETSKSGTKQKVARELAAARRRGVLFWRLIGLFPDMEQRESSRMTDSERENLALDMRAENPITGESLHDLEIRDRWSWIEAEDQVSELADIVIGEMNLSELSLQASNKDIYDKYDRLRAEGEFRQAVAVPLAVLSTVLAIRFAVEYESLAPLVLLVGLPLSVVVGLSGGRSLAQSRDLMVQAVLGGQAQSPTLQLIAGLLN